MSFHRRLARLEATRPDPQRDLSALVVRAFQGDRAASRVFAPRLRRALGVPDQIPATGLRLDPAALPRSDPSLANAIAALPPDVKAGVIAAAGERFGEPMSSVVARVFFGSAAMSAPGHGSVSIPSDPAHP